MAKFAVAVTFKVRDGEQDKAAALFAQISELANDFDGCELYAAHFMGSPGQFFVYQLFENEEAFHAFRKPDECNKLRKAVDALCTERERMFIVGEPIKTR